MRTDPTKLEWDTPPGGDFARYVERLTAPASAARGPQPPSGSIVAAPLSTTPTVAVSARIAARSTSPDLAEVLMPLFRVLRPARAVLLALMALHVATLFVFSQGSIAGLVVMAVLWWMLGWLMEAAPRALSSARPGGLPGMQPLHERLRQLAEQRTTGKKK